MQRKSRITLVMMAILLMVGMVGIQPVKPVQAALPPDLFFSEYIEGNGQNKAIEIYNGTGGSVDLTDYRLELYSNGASSPTASRGGRRASPTSSSGRWRRCRWRSACRARS